jgi:DNA-binding NarL/FixJ family response regulator
MAAICEHFLNLPEAKSQLCYEAKTALRVLLADDQEQVRQTVAEIVSEKFQVVGLAENGRRALELAYLLSPDVVLLDVSMPVMNGLEATSRLKKAGSEAKVVVLTVHDDPSFVEAALSAGASGYVLKTRLATDLIASILIAMKGGIFISESMNLE